MGWKLCGDLDRRTLMRGCGPRSAVRGRVEFVLSVVAVRAGERGTQNDQVVADAHQSWPLHASA